VSGVKWLWQRREKPVGRTRKNEEQKVSPRDALGKREGNAQEVPIEKRKESTAFTDWTHGKKGQMASKLKTIPTQGKEEARKKRGRAGPARKTRLKKGKKM